MTALARFVVVPVLAFIAACGGGEQHLPREQRIWDISAPALVRNYVDHNEAWTGQRIRILLSAKNYTVSGNAIFWHVSESRSWVIVFAGGFPPANNLRPAVVVGTCNGCQRDGQDRGGGVDFTVTVSECQIDTR